MPPIVFDLKTTDDPNDAVHLAVEFLAAGKRVALPTEAGYAVAVSALSESGVASLAELFPAASSHRFVLAVKSIEDALDYVPHMPVVGRRLGRRCWPGPLTMVLDGSHPDSLLTQLPESVRAIMVPDGTVALRVPDHQVFRDVSRLSIGPMVLACTVGSGATMLTDGALVAEQLGHQVDLVLTDGGCKFGQPPTVIRLDGNRCRILSEGVLGETTLKRMSSFLALMVCTGNTCRSPLAEVLFKKHLSEKIECGIDQLEDKGVIVTSAGVAAMPGAKASEESIEVAQKLGLDLTQHESQPVSDQLLESADLILTMTNSHRQALVTHWPEIADRTHVISVDGGDISDPIGGPLSQYENCARQIDQNLKLWADKTELGILE